MKIIIFILIAIIVIIGIAFIIMNRKRHTSLNQEIKDYEKLIDLMVEINKKLEEISEMEQNPDTRKILEIYTKSRNEYKERLDRYADAIDALQDKSSVFKIKEFNEAYEEVKQEFDGLDFKIKELCERVSAFAKIATDNQNVHFRIMSNLKELRAFFDTHLRIYEVYNNDFETLLASTNNRVMEYSELTKNSEFYKARQVVMSNWQDLQAIDEYTHKLASLFQVLTVGLPNITDTINLLVDKIEDTGYNLKINNLNDILSEINMNKEMLMENLKAVSFKELDAHNLRTIKVQIEELVESTTNILNDIEEQAGYVNELINVEETNATILERLDQVFEAAEIEVEDIRAKYNIDNTDQMLKVEELCIQYESFKTDYSRLVEIIHEAKDDFPRLIDRAKQAQSFLKHINNNVKVAIEQLRGIRYDEIRGQEVLEKYQNTLLEIELYLRRNKHYNSLSPRLREELLICGNLYDCLQQELAEEKINLEQVTNLTEKINNAFITLIGDKDSIGTLRKDIVRKLGCENLIKYIGLCSVKAGNNQRLEKSLDELMLMFKGNEYERCLGLAKQILENNYSRGNDMYKKVVKQEHLLKSVDEFAPVLQVAD